MSQSNIDQWVFRIAGSIVLLSALLAQFHHPAWLWLAALVGANMLQASFTGFCPMAKLLRRAGIGAGAAFPTAPRRGG